MTEPKLKVYFNNGLGVESFAIILRWYYEPDSRYFKIGGRTVTFDWDQVVMLTSMTGDEDQLTKYLAEEYMLPIFRELGVRYVQVGRAGPLERDGIVILSDSREPDTVYIEGAYKLSDELKLSGTVPQFGGGVHRCALKAKKTVCESFVDFDLNQPPVCSRVPGEGRVCAACERVSNGEPPDGLPKKRRSRKGARTRAEADAAEFLPGVDEHVRALAMMPRPEDFRDTKRRRDRLDALELLLEPTGDAPTNDAREAVPPDSPQDGNPLMPALRVFGFNADEKSRITESENAFADFNESTCGLVFGYNADETSRIRESDNALAEFNEKNFGLVFGFNAAEVSRIREAKSYDIAPRIGIYPLELWGWNRQRALDYIQERLGIRYVRSRCAYCPFSRLTPDDIERHRAHPRELADALLVEFIALAMNPRSTLYPNRSLYETAVENNMSLALRIFDAHIDSCLWGFYRVRRIYNPKGGDSTKKGLTDRAVERLATGTRAEMAREFTRRAEGLMVERHNNHLLAYVRHRSEVLFPTGEEYFVTCPATVETKAAYSMERFDRKWYQLIGFDPSRLSGGQATLHI